MVTDPQPTGAPVDANNRKTHRHRIEPSGPRRDNPATPGPGPLAVRSSTPENFQGHIDPSPEDTNATPGTIPKK